MQNRFLRRIRSLASHISRSAAPSVGDVARAALDRVVKKCLAKDPDDRWQTARDLKAELIWIAGGGAESPGQTKARTTWVPWAIAGVLAVVAAFAGWMLKP